MKHFLHKATTTILRSAITISASISALLFILDMKVQDIMKCKDTDHSKDSE